jgi:tRNA U34 2-thiouridine synthase MnmA/TrmU
VVSPLENGSANVAYTQQQIGAAKGQAIVFYCGDTVLGGGTAA